MEKNNVVEKPAARLPDFLIIGEMRCGSTTLWEMLRHHPGVYFSEEKELHFFDGRDGKWDRGIDWYSQKFSGSCEGMICGEATPDYLFHDDACSRIAATIPNAKLVVILRDPVERAWSHYWHNIRRGRESLSFREAMEAERERMDSKDADIRAHFSYATRGHYIESLRRYEEVFGKDAIHVVFLEDVKVSRKKMIEGVCGHLALEVVPEMLEERAPQRNKAEYPRWPGLSAVARGAMKRVSGNRLLEVPARKIAELTRPLRTYSGKSEMDQDIRKQLVNSYASSNKALSEWMGREVPWARSKND
ncbi:sulfotransferase family protein [Haloferula sp.]|uniref:sulfotransferase family protein n=1 Tax=Haloferula sp. TaxID=2497595 RepID=UPI003C78554C